MPYKLRWEGHGVYRRFFGVVSSSEFREAYDETKGDLRYECIRYIISDYLEAEAGPDLTDTFLGRVEQLSRLEYDCGPDIVHATVATGEKMLEHIRYFESLPLAPYPEATFATIDAARQWIVNNPRPAWRMALPPAAAVTTPRGSADPSAAHNPQAEGLHARRMGLASPVRAAPKLDAARDGG